MRILFLSRWFPYPTTNGSKIRIYQLLRGLAKQHTVSLLSFADETDANPDSPELAALCESVQTIPWKEFEPQSSRGLLGIFKLEPRSIVDTFSPQMAEAIVNTVRSRRIELVIASQGTMASYARFFKSVPALYEEVEVGVFHDRFVNAASVKSKLRHGLTWAKHRRYLAKQLGQFAACTVASEQEQQLVARVAPDYRTIEVIPNCIDVADYQQSPQREPNTLIFTGPFKYHANHEAMVWFLTHVYPLVQEAVPGVHLLITGDHANLPLPKADNVTLTGFVDDVRRLIGRSWISLAPLQTGGGTRLKILEAMALGTPVVATTKGAEGLDGENEKHLLIADAPDAFADATIRLLKDQQLAAHLANNGHALVSEQYDWKTKMPQFLDLLERVSKKSD